MTCLALGAKCDSPTRPAGNAVGAACAKPASRSAPSNDARAAVPSAFAPRLKNWRRVSLRAHSFTRFMMCGSRQGEFGFVIM